jgi:twinkle protein
MIATTYADYGIEIPYGKTNGKVKTICPQCHETRTNKRDKSLSVDLDQGIWHCHYCGWSGTLHHHTDEEKRAWMKQQYWFRPPQVGKKKKPEYRLPEERVTGSMEQKALAWFYSRGISAETLRDMKVTEGMEWMPQKQGKANTVQFNYYRDGKLVNTKFRTGDKCFKLCSGAELIPYNLDAIKDTKECIITEGEMDALSFYECGRHDVVSVPNGANANLDYLDDYIDDYFENKETIYIAVDTDTKGVMLRDELLHRFGKERCRVVEYGEDCKDANEHLMAHGKESLLQCLADAPEFKVDGVFSLTDFETSLDAIYEEGLQKGVTVGHDNLDDLISFETKRLCIVTGIPSSGKSEFIDEIAERLNIRYHWRFAYFSPENAPLAYHVSKLIEKFSGKKFVKGRLPVDEYSEVKEHIETDFYFIYPEEDYKLTTILAKAKYLVRKKGIKALVIDPFNYLEDENEGQNETERINKMLDRMSRFAKLEDILIILMAHPAKQHKNKDGVLEPPTLYDISGSAHFYNRADFGLVIHRDRATDTVQVIVAKVRFRHLGQPGTALFKYNLNNGRYVPFNPSISTQINWDNSNHLREEEQKRLQRQREQNEHRSFITEDTFRQRTDDCPF